VLELKSGKVISGIIVEEKGGEVHVRTNPTEPAGATDAGAEKVLVIPLDEIEEKVTSKISLMPVGLLNTLNEDEILDLLAWVLSGGE
jgi:hypothetical protein